MTDFLSKLRDPARPPQFGTCIINPSPHYLAVATACKLDFVFLDTEHIALDRHPLAWMCQAYGASGIIPIVRIPSVNRSDACTALAGGAKGIVAPYVETVDEVLELVSAAKLRPLKGKLLTQALAMLRQVAFDKVEEDRKAGKPTPSANAGYDDPLDRIASLVTEETLAFMRKKSDGISLFINIESVPAMEKLSHLLSVPGVDGVFIGPHDLSVQLGIPEQWENPRLLEACDSIVVECARQRLTVGNHYSFAHAVEYQLRWQALGLNLVIHSADVKLFMNALKADLTQLRKEVGVDETAAAGTTEKLVI